MNHTLEATDAELQVHCIGFGAGAAAAARVRQAPRRHQEEDDVPG